MLGCWGSRWQKCYVACGPLLSASRLLTITSTGERDTVKGEAGRSQSALHADIDAISVNHPLSIDVVPHTSTRPTHASTQQRRTNSGGMWTIGSSGHRAIGGGPKGESVDVAEQLPQSTTYAILTTETTNIPPQLNCEHSNTTQGTQGGTRARLHTEDRTRHTTHRQRGQQTLTSRHQAITTHISHRSSTSLCISPPSTCFTLRTNPTDHDPLSAPVTIDSRLPLCHRHSQLTLRCASSVLLDLLAPLLPSLPSPPHHVSAGDDDVCA